MLVVNSKEAIDKLWKARGYDHMKPVQRKKQLRYTRSTARRRWGMS